MEKNTGRKYLKARRRWKDERKSTETKSTPSPRNTQCTPSSSSITRKVEGDVTPVKRIREEVEEPSLNGAKYSANDRLKKYRKILEENKQQSIKVHKALLNTSTSYIETNSSCSTASSKQKTNRKLYSATLTASEGNVRNKFATSSVIGECKSFNFIPEPSTVNDDCDMGMDWSPINEEAVVSDVCYLYIHRYPHILSLNSHWC